MSSVSGGGEVKNVGNSPPASNHSEEDRPAESAGIGSKENTGDGEESSERQEPNNGKDTVNAASTPPPQSYPGLYDESSPYLGQINAQQSFGYYVDSPPPPTGTGDFDLRAAILQQQQSALAQQQATAGAGPPFGLPDPPLSPQQTSPNSSSFGLANTSISMGVVPPASPLFSAAPASGAFPVPPLDQIDSAGLPRVPSASSGAPSVPSPALSYSLPGSVYNTGMYQGYGGYGNPTGNVTPPLSPEHQHASWSDRSLFQQNAHNFAPPPSSPSPQLHPQGLPMQYQVGSGRAYRSPSFEEMLPPAALDSQDRSQSSYSHFGAAQAASALASGGPLPPPYGYGNPGEQHHHHGHHHGHGGPGRGGYHHNRPGGHVGSPYYGATTPGPPIQTTASNKGPDGANLFIFHIPNHFTNLDMYHLFCHYGTLLSVRIMVEKDTGRSRGFGFVSYDSPDSAAMAIKELNGFVIGNKRLKVQHKQIRASDRPQHHSNQEHSGYPISASHSGEGGTYPQHDGDRSDLLPPSSEEDAAPPDSGAWFNSQQHSESTGGRPPLHRSHDPEVPNDAQFHGSGVGNPTSSSGAAPSLGKVTREENVSEADTEGANMGANRQAGDRTNAPVSPLMQLDQLRSALPDLTK